MYAYTIEIVYVYRREDGLEGLLSAGANIYAHTVAVIHIRGSQIHLLHLLGEKKSSLEIKLLSARYVIW